MKFTHLNQHQRYQIESRLNIGHSPSLIARALGVDRSTIYRERNKGLVRNRYSAQVAQQRTLQHRAVSAANHPTKPEMLWKAVRQCLCDDWSPQQIGRRLKLTGGIAGIQVSHQAIYDWLRRSSTGMATHLRHHRPPTLWRRGGGGLPKGRPSIRKRPKDVALRTAAGHWEGDTVRGRTPQHCIVTLVERKSLFTKLSVPLRKDSMLVARAVRRSLTALPALSLTLDNGTEFAAYADMGLPVYFADPGCPRQRARNENTNGLLRQYIPKQARLTDFTSARIRRIEQRLNDRPRKSLGYKTPREVLFNLKPAPVAIRT